MLKDIELRFFDLDDWAGCCNQEITRFRSDRLHEVNFNNYEKNCLKGYGNREQWLPVFGNVLALYSGMYIGSACVQVVEDSFLPEYIEISFDRFLQICETVIDKEGWKNVGVHLSGGLDSSLIIGILAELGVKFALVGLESHRYEFRTERYVQEILAKSSADVHLIDEKDYLPCGELDRVPSHLFPDVLSLNLNQDRAMAEACRNLGVKTLLGGGGGDVLLGGRWLGSNNGTSIRPQTFTDHFSQTYAYRPEGVDFCSFFQHPDIINAIYSLRKGQDGDERKLWARHYFQSILPRVLVDYSYCADFWGRDIEGLSVNFERCFDLVKEAFKKTGDTFFDPKKFKRIYERYGFRCDQHYHQILEARISAALWLNSGNNECEEVLCSLKFKNS